MRARGDGCSGGGDVYGEAEKRDAATSLRCLRRRLQIHAPRFHKPASTSSESPAKVLPLADNQNQSMLITGGKTISRVPLHQIAPIFARLRIWCRKDREHEKSHRLLCFRRRLSAVKLFCWLALPGGIQGCDCFEEGQWSCEGDWREEGKMGWISKLEKVVYICRASVPTSWLDSAVMV